MESTYDKVVDDYKKNVSDNCDELLEELTKWAEGKYLDENGQNIKPLNDDEVLIMLDELEKYISEIDKANGYKYSKIPEGRKIIPYTDGYGNIWAWELADVFAQSTSDYAFVSDTAIGKLSMDSGFETLLHKITGNLDEDYVDGLLWGTQGKDGIKSKSPILSTDGYPRQLKENDPVAFVDYLSERVMSEEVGNAYGDVFALVSNSQNYNVFIRTEFLTLLNNSKVTSINGVSRTDLLSEYKALVDDNPTEEEKYDALYEIFQPVKENCDKYLSKAYFYIDRDTGELLIDFSKCEELGSPVNPAIPENAKLYSYDSYMEAVQVLIKEFSDNDVLKFLNYEGKYTNYIYDVNILTILEFLEDLEISQTHQGDISFKYSDYINARDSVNKLLNPSGDADSYAVKVAIDVAMECIRNGVNSETLSKLGIMSDDELLKKYAFLVNYNGSELNALRGFEYLISSNSSEKLIREAGFLTDGDLKKKYSFLEACTDANIFSNFRIYEYFLPTGKVPLSIDDTRAYLDENGNIVELSDSDNIGGLPDFDYSASFYDLINYNSFTDYMLSEKLGDSYGSISGAEKWMMKEFYYCTDFIDDLLAVGANQSTVAKYLEGCGKTVEELTNLDYMFIILGDEMMYDESKFLKIVNCLNQYPAVGNVLTGVADGTDIIGAVVLIEYYTYCAAESFIEGDIDQAAVLLSRAAKGWAVEVLGIAAGGTVAAAEIASYLYGVGMMLGPAGAAVGAIAGILIGYGLAGYASSEIGEFISESWSDIYEFLDNPIAEIEEEVQELYGRALSIIDRNADGAYFKGSDKDDYMVGGAGDNVMEGLKGDDKIYGRDGNDEIYGGDGDDKIYGGNGHDTIYGGNGNDRLNGGNGVDYLYGGAGDDTFVWGRGYNTDWIYDSDGVNRVVFSDLVPSDLRVVYSDNYLAYAIIKDTGEKLYFPEMKYCLTDKCDFKLEFADGSVMSVDSPSSPFVTNIEGDESDDTLYGLFENSTIKGNAGNDTLQGTNGNDILLGGDGDDILSGGNGNDTLIGGPGNDYLYGGNGDDLYEISAGDGTDIIIDDSGLTTIDFKGISKDDLLVSAMGTDDAVIFSKTHDNYVIIKNFRKMKPENVALLFDGIDGIPVNDLTSPFLNVHGSNVDDDIKAFFEHGNLYGYEGNDLLYGTSGDDTIYGMEGDDYLQGYDGNDYLYGGDGDDDLRGGSGNDVLDGSDGNDELYGNNGDDILYGGAGDDYFEGGNGNDTIYAGDGDDIVYGNDGDDIIYAGNGDDTVSGSTGDDFIDGGAGNDELYGSVGDDTYVYGVGYGNDVIEDSSGTNRIKFVGVKPSDLSVFYPSGNDNAVLTIIPTGETLTIKYFCRSTVYQNFTLEFDDGTEMRPNSEGSPFLNVVGTESGEKIIAYYGKSIVHALGGDDTVNGTNGNDTIFGGDGNDTLNGSGGDDILDGGAGNDELYGSVGDDTYIYGVGYGNDVIEDSSGTNRIKFVGVKPSDLSVFYPSGNNNAVLTITPTGETLTIKYFCRSTVYQNFTLEFDDGTEMKINGEGSPFLNVVGTEAGEKVIAYYGNSIVHALGGDDTVNGTNGNDTIYGGDGDDYVSGSGGDDFIDGGAGNDELYGSVGNDTYVYGVGYGNDVIEDGSGTNRIKFVGVNPSELSVFYPSGNNNAVLTITPTGETLTIKNFRWSGVYRNFTLEFDDGTTGKIDYSSGTIILDDSDGTDTTDTAGLPVDYLGENIIQASADMLSALYEGYDLTSKLFAGINSYVTAASDVSEKAPIGAKREIINYRTDIQTMILAENMAAFGAGSNIYDSFNNFDLTDDTMLTSQLFVNSHVL